MFVFSTLHQSHVSINLTWTDFIVLNKSLKGFCEIEYDTNISLISRIISLIQGLPPQTGFIHTKRLEHWSTGFIDFLIYKKIEFYGFVFTFILYAYFRVFIAQVKNNKDFKGFEIFEDLLV